MFVCVYAKAMAHYSVFRHLRPKCHALLLDDSINGRFTVLTNIYHMLVLAAMKMHCHVALLPQHPHPRLMVGM